MILFLCVIVGYACFWLGANTRVGFFLGSLLALAFGLALVLFPAHGIIFEDHSPISLALGIPTILLGLWIVAVALSPRPRVRRPDGVVELQEKNGVWQ